MRGFIQFFRTQGIVGLAIGFIIGSASQQFVNSLSQDIISPTVSLALGRFGDLASASTTVSGATFAWGHLLSQFINLILVALIIYLAITYFNAKAFDAPKDGHK